MPGLREEKRRFHFKSILLGRPQESHNQETTRCPQTQRNLTPSGRVSRVDGSGSLPCGSGRTYFLQTKDMPAAAAPGRVCHYPLENRTNSRSPSLSLQWQRAPLPPPDRLGVESALKQGTCLLHSRPQGPRAPPLLPAGRASTRSAQTRTRWHATKGRS